MLRAQTPLQAAPGPLAPHPAPCPHCWHSLLQEQDDVLWRLDGCVELDQIAVVQLVHNLDLKLHHFLGAKEVGGTIQVSSLPALHPLYLRPDQTTAQPSPCWPPRLPSLPTLKPVSSQTPVLPVGTPRLRGSSPDRTLVSRRLSPPRSSLPSFHFLLVHAPQAP